jgi:Zinc dependent phospholipase C
MSAPVFLDKGKDKKVDRLLIKSSLPARGASSSVDKVHICFNLSWRRGRAGVKIIISRYPLEKGTKEFERALAWLYGYASHIVFDSSVHPVVRAIVGEYEKNKTEHRACEMFMDTFIYKEIFGEELNNGQWVGYMKSLTDITTGGMDPSVSNLWKTMLKEVHPS